MFIARYDLRRIARVTLEDRNPHLDVDVEI